MRKTQVNPWQWQDARGYSQAWRVDGAASYVFVAGQCPIDEFGNLVGIGDFGAQARRTLDNLRTVLEQAGATMADIVQVRVYLTDIAKLPEFGKAKASFISGRQPASTAIGVSALAIEGMLVEIDALAVIAENSSS